MWKKMSYEHLKQLSEKLWMFKVLKCIPHFKNCECFFNVAYKFLSKKFTINFFLLCKSFSKFFAKLSPFNMTIVHFQMLLTKT